MNRNLSAKESVKDGTQDATLQNIGLNWIIGRISPTVDSEGMVGKIGL